MISSKLQGRKMETFITSLNFTTALKYLKSHICDDFLQ